MRHVVRLAFVAVAAGLCLGGPTLAGDHGLVGGPSAHGGLAVDPQILPPDTRPGECVSRRVTGPGGAYRWERVECDDGERGWNEFDRWSYGRAPLTVEDGRPDRYGHAPRAYDPPPPPPPAYAEADYGHDGYGRDGYGQYGYERHEESFERTREHGYDSGYVGDRYGPHPPSVHDGYDYAYSAYASAGRDAYGFLVWPGKQP